MLTCTFDDGDTWLLLWLLTAFVVAIVALLLMHFRGLQFPSCSK
nr:E5 DELTA [human papillomavirus 74]WAB54245.1 E5 DELTA [human papillomavirus 74]